MKGTRDGLREARYDKLVFKSVREVFEDIYGVGRVCLCEYNVLVKESLKVGTGFYMKCN